MQQRTQYILLLVAGCSLPDTKYETRRLEIAPYFDFPICAGTAHEFDSFIEKTEADMGLPPSASKIKLYWGAEGVEEHCPEVSVGCYSSRKYKAIFIADGTVAKHEFVHAVAGRLPGDTIPLFEEGIADALSGRSWAEKGTVEQVKDAFSYSYQEYLDKSSTFPVATGTHFLTFLIDKYGLQSALTFRQRVPDGSAQAVIADTFLEIYAITIDEAIAEWQIEAPRAYPMAQASPVPTIKWDKGIWEFEASLDCDDLNTHGPLDSTDGSVQGMSRTETLDVVDVIEVEVMLSADASTKATLDSSFCGLSMPHLIEPNQPVTLKLSPCRWQATVFTSQTTPTDATLTITITDET